MSSIETATRELVFILFDKVFGEDIWHDDAEQFMRMCETLDASARSIDAPMSQATHELSRSLIKAWIELH